MQRLPQNLTKISLMNSKLHSCANQRALESQPQCLCGNTTKGNSHCVSLHDTGPKCMLSLCQPRRVTADTQLHPGPCFTASQHNTTSKAGGASAVLGGGQPALVSSCIQSGEAVLCGLVRRVYSLQSQPRLSLRYGFKWIQSKDKNHSLLCILCLWEPCEYKITSAQIHNQVLYTSRSRLFSCAAVDLFYLQYISHLATLILKQGSRTALFYTLYAYTADSPCILHCLPLYVLTVTAFRTTLPIVKASHYDGLQQFDSDKLQLLHPYFPCEESVSKWNVWKASAKIQQLFKKEKKREMGTNSLIIHTQTQ